MNIDSIIAAEGDSFEWTSSGYGCFMLRTPLLNWCGYVSIPASHPWSGLRFDTARVTPLPDRDVPDIAPNVFGMFIEAMRDSPDDGLYPLDLVLAVHGGVTYSDIRCSLRGQSADDKRWTFGFDCAHAGDLVPGIWKEMNRDVAEHLSRGDVYRDRDYVFAETSRLAAQLRMVHERGF